MKKTFCVIASVLLAAVTTSAQLKVDSTGKVSIDRTVGTAYSTLCLGNHAPSATEMAHYQRGIGCSIQSLSKDFNVGITSSVHDSPGFNSHRAIGMLGIAGNATQGYNYGIVGGLTGTANGAGIFGTTYHTTGVIVQGKYAGYFDGDTYVSGTLTANSLVTPSDMRLKENVTLLSEEDGDATLDNLLGLNVISYNYRHRSCEQEADTASAMTPSQTGRKALERQRHYGLSAQELQKVYPNLVHEGQDGYLAVNYTELVPILIRSIQELKAELDEVKGRTAVQQDETARRDRQSTATGMADKTAATTQATLYQNQPNPFTSQTVIRFSLPENAPASYIYIFDMQGKMVRQLPVNPLMQSVTINGYELQAGIYLYSLVVGGQEIDTKRMLLSK